MSGAATKDLVKRGALVVGVLGSVYLGGQVISALLIIYFKHSHSCTCDL